LALLLEARHEDGSPMSDADVRDELITLLVAGHETTATTLSWALERLTRSPVALERATSEAFGADGACPYLDAVVRETLRVRPPVMVVPRCVHEPFELAGWTIPPGTVVAPCPLLLHHRPDLYPDPDAFRPERFLDRTPGTYTWIPALLQTRIMLSTLLARVTVSAEEPEPEAMRYRAVTLLPARGARVLVQPRAEAAA
jgi:cytochrome P450 family 135